MLPLMGVAFLTNIPLYAVFIVLKLYRIISEHLKKKKKERNAKKAVYEETVKLKDSESI